MEDLTSYIKTMRHEDEEAHTQMLAMEYGLPYVNLVGYPILPDILTIIPEDFAKQNQAVAFVRAGNKVRVAVVDPTIPNLKPQLDTIAAQNKYIFSYTVCSPSSFRFAFSIYQKASATKPLKEGVNITTSDADASFADIQNLRDLKSKILKVSTTSLLDLIFAGAVKTDAADIHLEPCPEGVRIRYRIDGVLQEVSVLPPESYKALTSRIKYLANLKLDVKNVPQDGRFTINALDQPIDIRVSTMPASGGEVIDMRLLNSRNQIIDIASLGIRPDALAFIEEAIVKPNGLILNTGPTGSGKTTTLYAILTKLNKPGVKIITLEDPIEYRIPGIDQVQIESEKNYTFATALRASLRQDPNVIMVGEIRDKETAEIGLQAAMTGHLVLSTLHTNNAPSSIPRLIDMGVEPYLLAGSINLIIAQRLVRKICSTCAGKGCEICNETGYKGRIAIIECLKPTPNIEKLIMAKAPVSEFLKVAKEDGMKTMEQDGLEKVQLGITTQEEVWRVTKE